MKKICFIYILCLFSLTVSPGCGLYAQDCFPKDKLPSHITPLTDFGERPEWSNDGKIVFFIDKAGGDLWSVDISTKKTSRITNPEDRPAGHGFYRIACLANGDLLLCCGAERHRLYFQVLDKSFSKPPVTIEGGGWDEGGEGCEVLGININTGKIVNYSKAPDIYDEPEGIFPNGEYTLVECNKHQPQGKTGTIDIYKLKLDGSGNSERLTFFADEMGYRASNPVVNRSGNMIAFSGSRANMDAGQGCGLFLFDLKEFEKTIKSVK